MTLTQLLQVTRHEDLHCYSRDLPFRWWSAQEIQQKSAWSSCNDLKYRQPRAGTQFGGRKRGLKASRYRLGHRSPPVLLPAGDVPGQRDVPLPRGEGGQAPPAHVLTPGARARGLPGAGRAAV